MSRPSQPLRVGLSIRTFNPASGGLQAHAQRLATELQARGHEVRVVTRTVWRGQSYADFFRFSEPASSTEIAGIPVHVLARGPAWNVLLWMVSKCVVRPALRPLGIALYRRVMVGPMFAALRGVEVVHHVGQAFEMLGFAAGAVARRLTVPFVAQPTVHPGQWGDSPLDCQLYRQADALLVHTAYEQAFLAARGLPGPYQMVGNGIEDRSDGDACRFRGTHQLGDAPLILYLGRKQADKGYPLALAAFRLIRAQRSDAVLVCMGPPANSCGADSSAEGRLTEGVLELGFGSEEAKHDALAACTLLCVPSEGESFGLVYMEAGRYGKPVIGRRLPVLEELLGRHEAALLVGTVGKQGGVSASAEEVATAVLQILGEPDLAQRLGENIRRVSAEFTWSKVVARFEAAYRATLAAAPR